MNSSHISVFVCICSYIKFLYFSPAKLTLTISKVSGLKVSPRVSLFGGVKEWIY
jgi:hypothetical protein